MQIKKLLQVKEWERIRMENEEEMWKARYIKTLNKFSKEKKPKKKNNKTKPENKYKPHHDIIRAKEDTSFENYTGNVWEAEDWGTIDIIFQIADETLVA